MSLKSRLLCMICGFLLLGTTLTACMSAEGHLEKGDKYFDSDRLEEAITEYSQAIKIDPEYIIAYHHRGVAHDKEGRLDMAIADYNKAIGLGAESSQLYYDRGIAYAKKKQWGMAIADYNKAIDLGTESAQLYYDRGIAYENKEQWDQAVKDYETCMTAYPNDPCAVEAEKAFLKCHYEWALSLLCGSQYDAAIQKLDIIINANSDNQYVVKTKEILDEYSAFDNAVKHEHNGEYDVAIDELKAFISKYPKSIFISRVDEILAECYYQNALKFLKFPMEYIHALENYEIVLRDYPDSIWASKENAKKICEYIMRRVYNEPDGRLAKNAGMLLAKACKENIYELLPYLNSYETHDIYYALIKIGDPTTTQALILALNGTNDKYMATDYLNCGNPELENAATQWAIDRNYYVVTSKEGNTWFPSWGSGLELFPAFK